MCGIAGYVTLKPGSEPSSTLEQMTSVIQHRGPDEVGFHREARVYLGHRRLSIIDLSTGQQPMSNEDGRVTIVYNGELFNHAGLRPDLERRGHRYRTHSDTETILHSWEEYGRDCVRNFRGMYAFAIWDQNRQTLFCARDRVGKKPLYYYWDGSLFAFASEIKALFEHPRISPGLEESLLPEYLAFGYVSEERTLFRGIRKLMPGHTLELDLSRPEPAPDIRPYWSIPQSSGEQQSDEAWIRQCRQLIEQSVQMRLMSDVPLGMFLSGGLDSSTIAALMKRMVSGPVKTFAVGYSEAAYSELGYARQVANSIGTDHHEVVVGMDDFFDAMPRMIWQEDEPITWPSSVSLYFCAKLAREQVTVVLTGEGSDELFGGYARYQRYYWNERWLRYYRILPAPLRRAIRSFVTTSPLLSGDLRRRLHHTFLGRDDSLESIYLDNFYAAFDQPNQREIFTFQDHGAPYRNFRRHWDDASSRSPLGRMLYADQMTYLIELLMKQDQMSMASSLESRVPFLDHKLVEFSVNVPDHLKIRNGHGKYIVKKAVEDLLPADIIYRPKMGFPTPIRDWLRDRRSDDLLASLTRPNSFIAPYVHMPAVRSLLERHRGGREDATDRIWRLLNLQVWGELFLTGERERVWPARSYSGS